MVLWLCLSGAERELISSVAPDYEAADPAAGPGEVGADRIRIIGKSTMINMQV